MLNVVMPSVVILSVVAQQNCSKNGKKITSKQPYIPTEHVFLVLFNRMSSRLYSFCLLTCSMTI
jgi:hypothetical protein